MAGIKFSCPNCGQHIACDEPWAGHLLECPACHSSITVPLAQTPPGAVVRSAPAPAREASPEKPRLAAGITQIARSTAHGPLPERRLAPRPPRAEGSLLKYALLLTVAGALGAGAYFYGLPLLKKTLEQAPDSSPSTGATSSQTSGGAGPLGEVNGAMDVSEALEGGSSPKTHSAPATNAASHPKPGAPRR
jgi:hypothetical protein